MQSDDRRPRALPRARGTSYIRLMAFKRKPLEVPPEAAAQFVKDMQAFFRAKGQLAEDEIASTAAWRLKQHLPKGTKLGKTTVKELFHAMREQLCDPSSKHSA